MSNILDKMIEKSHTRGENWTPTFVDKLPDPYTLEEVTIIGTYSFTMQASRRRLLVERELIRLDQDHRETPPAVARDYLYATFGRGPRVKRAQMETNTDGLRPAPNFAAPCQFPEGYYIDIRSAYWDIMKIAGWNVDYWPGKWLSPGQVPEDFPFPEHKIARNCLVSAGTVRPILRFIPDKRPDPFDDKLSPGNPLANTGLIRLITDILNAIAGQAVDLGAVYVNNDGYIVKSHKAAADVCQLIFDYGLVPQIKGEGPGEVKSSGAYKVGAMTSAPYLARTEPRAVSAIQRPKYTRWLRQAFAFQASENLHIDRKNKK
jgi:hypothetical protein